MERTSKKARELGARGLPVCVTEDQVSCGEASGVAIGSF